MKLPEFESIGRDLRDSILHILRDFSEALILALLMALVLRVFVFGSYRISNPTMEPNLKMGDFVLGYKLPYGFQVPFTDTHVGRARVRRGEMVVFRCPGKEGAICIKRVIGLPGDRIEVIKQRLVLNGRSATYNLAAPQGLDDVFVGSEIVLEERWRTLKTNILISKNGQAQNFGPYIVPPGSFFVLGDNRDVGEDSRHWGAIPLDRLEARVFFVWFSIDWQRMPDSSYESRVRSERIFRLVR